jgi:hypothetical protein
MLVSISLMISRTVRMENIKGKVIKTFIIMRVEWGRVTERVARTCFFIDQLFIFIIHILITILIVNNYYQILTDLKGNISFE